MGNYFLYYSRIKKVYRDIMSAKSHGRSSEQKSCNFDFSMEDVGSTGGKIRSGSGGLLHKIFVGRFFINCINRVSPFVC